MKHKIIKCLVGNLLIFTSQDPCCTCLLIHLLPPPSLLNQDITVIFKALVINVIYLQSCIFPVRCLCKAACNVSPLLQALALTPLLPTSPPVPASSPLNLLPPTSSEHCGCQLGCCHLIK